MSNFFSARSRCGTWEAIATIFARNLCGTWEAPICSNVDGAK